MNATVLSKQWSAFVGSGPEALLLPIKAVMLVGLLGAISRDLAPILKRGKLLYRRIGNEAFVRMAQRAGSASAVYEHFFDKLRARRRARREPDPDFAWRYTAYKLGIDTTVMRTCGIRRFKTPHELQEEVRELLLD